MKSYILLIILFLCPVAYGDGVGDEIMYNYFQNLIDNGHDNLNTLMDNNKAELLSANVFNVSEDLKKHNVSHKLLNIAPVFEQFYNSINNIMVNYNDMVEYSDVENSSNYIIFKTSLKNVHSSLIVLNDSLNKIDKITLKDRDGNILKFDTSKVRSDINILLKDTELYSNKLNKIAPEGFVIYSDSSTVFINSEITIYGYIKNRGAPIDSITLYHNNISYNIKLENNSFSKTFLIDKLGNHVFYATSPSGTSNMLKISCLKIPTHINVIYENKKYVGNDANLKIELCDYYGNKLKDNVYIDYLDTHKNMRAPLNLNIKSNVEKNITVNIEYKGNSIYNKSKKTATISFVRIPTYITANYEGNKIIGKLFDKDNNLLNNKDIYLEMDNKTYISKTRNGSFEFNMSNNAHDECHIFFKGDSKYKPSSKKLIKDKNIMLIFNSNNNGYILSFMAVVLLLVLIIYRIQRRRDMKDMAAEEDEGIIHDAIEALKIKGIYLEFEKYISNKKYVEGIIRTYSSFIHRLNIQKSLTPREICRRYSNIKGLKTITKIFEKVYYGNMEPKKDDIEKYDKFFKGS